MIKNKRINLIRNQIKSPALSPLIQPLVEEEREVLFRRAILTILKRLWAMTLIWMILSHQVCLSIKLKLRITPRKTYSWNKEVGSVLCSIQSWSKQSQSRIQALKISPEGGLLLSWAPQRNLLKDLVTKSFITQKLFTPPPASFSTQNRILKAFFRITPKNKCQKRRVFKPSSATWFLSKLITSVKRIKFGRVSSQEPRKQRPLRTLKCKRTSS